jgi:predicted PolB exonuclease-like 3'-5' exonuclease
VCVSLQTHGVVIVKFLESRLQTDDVTFLTVGGIDQNHGVVVEAFLALGGID